MNGERNITTQLNQLEKQFLLALNKYEDHCFEEMKASWPMSGIHLLVGPINEMIDYVIFFAEKKIQSNLMLLRLRLQAKKIVHRFISFLISAREACEPLDYLIKPDKAISAADWYSIWSSVLLASCNKEFSTTFAREKVLIERLLLDDYHQISRPFPRSSCPKCSKAVSDNGSYIYCASCKFYVTDEIKKVCLRCQVCYCSTCKRNLGTKNYCESCKTSTEYKGGVIDECIACHYKFIFVPDLSKSLKCTYTEYGTIEPLDKEIYEKCVRIKIPGSISDQNHYGHLLHKFCQLSEMCE
jgi:hypothetical protein